MYNKLKGDPTGGPSDFSCRLCDKSGWNFIALVLDLFHTFYKKKIMHQQQHYKILRAQKNFHVDLWNVSSRRHVTWFRHLICWLTWSRGFPMFRRRMEIQTSDRGIISRRDHDEIWFNLTASDLALIVLIQFQWDLQRLIYNFCVCVCGGARGG